MPGYKQWSDGDNLTPADIDGFLMGQSVMRFANAAARSAAILTPVDGMMSYLADTGLVYIYDSGAVAWVPDKQAIKKATTTSRASTVVNADDPDLQVSLVPGQYRVELFMHLSGPVAADISIAWAFTGAATANRAARGMAVLNSDGTGATSPYGIRMSGHSLGTSVNYGIDTGTAVINEDLLLTVTAAGVLKVQWSQNVTNTTAVVVSTASRIYLTRFR